MKLVLHTVSKNPEQSPIEFIHYALELTNTIIMNPTLRNEVLMTELVGMKNACPEGPCNYIAFLQLLEKLDQIKSVNKLKQKIKRQKKELEQWLKVRQAKLRQEQEKMEELEALPEGQTEGDKEAQLAEEQDLKEMKKAKGQ